MLADADAERVVRDYSDLILRLSNSYLQSSYDSADVCQDVLLKLLMRTHPFKSLDHERAWVIRVTINECKNRLAKASRRYFEPLECSEILAKTDESPDVAGLHEAIRELPSDQGAAIYLRYFEGYKVLEVAELLGKSEAAVAMDLSRARVRLRKALGGEVRDG